MKLILVFTLLILALTSLILLAPQKQSPPIESLPSSGAPVMPATRPLTMHCPVLAPFDAVNWSEIEKAFASAPSIEFAQSWRRRLQSDFQPGTVRLGRVEQTLWVLADMTDEDIYNSADKLNQPTYLLGDTFEMFFRPLSQIEYYELHISPDNQKFQLRFQVAPGSGSPEEVAEKNRHPVGELPTVESTLIQSWTQILPEQKKWRVLSAVPAASICRNGRIEPGDEWLFSFGRYDYTRGQRRPVWSSTSPHRRPDFHRQHEWGKLIFSE